MHLTDSSIAHALEIVLLSYLMSAKKIDSLHSFILNESAGSGC
jgi:hypothetical protein